MKGRDWVEKDYHKDFSYDLVPLCFLFIYLFIFSIKMICMHTHTWPTTTMKKPFHVCHLGFEVNLLLLP